MLQSGAFIFLQKEPDAVQLQELFGEERKRGVISGPPALQDWVERGRGPGEEPYIDDVDDVPVLPEEAKEV